ncbi:MAG: c-type cytochrome [Phycisphaerae bacterium]|nr:c-type cytochrome [Phycisphaerae bacterium]
MTNASLPSHMTGLPRQWCWPHELAALALAIGMGAAALAVMVGAAYMMRALQIRLTPNPNAPLPIAALPPEPELDLDSFVHGRAIFSTVCAMCHGPDGRGIRGLGRDLTHSLFVCDQRDSALASFIRKGRTANDPLNLTKVEMPPRGGRPDMTDENVSQVVTYLRGLQDPRRVPAAAATTPNPVVLVPPPPSQDDLAKALAAAGGDAELAEYIANGSRLFASSCTSCHGRDAKGMPNLGKDLTVSTFIAERDDDQMLEFLKRGRDPNDPLNTSKVAMPPKGGNPALSEDDLLDIVAFLRSIHARGPAAAK